MAKRKITLAEIEASRVESNLLVSESKRRKKRAIVDDYEDEEEEVEKETDGRGGGRGREEEEEDNENGEDGEYQDSRDRGSISNEDQDLQHDVNQVVKLILQRELKGQFFKRELIAQNLTNKRFKSDVLLREATKILENVYGMTLVEGAARKNKQEDFVGIGGGGISSGSKLRKSHGARRPLVLVCNLSKEAKDVLGELWSIEVSTSLDKTKLGDCKFFLPKYSKVKGLPRSNYDLIKTGLTMVIITFVVLNENHISEQQLITSMKKFGISDKEHVRNSNYDMNIQELIKELDAKEYIVKKELGITQNDRSSASGGATASFVSSSSQTSNSEKMFSYALGRRSLVEFTPQSVFDYIKIVYGDAFTDAIAESTIVTIERAYGVALAQDENNGSSQVDSPSGRNGGEREQSMNNQ
ncbi:hypothetical protein KGF56_000557 [Candida oxycetoniae]|uniref:MAGE domain-containing protein n=1 Tax=Candida oxycetoniae TaxID=497107 RepID=A0AAI9T0P8_9ASCO|nr:uncharacterized protein KGF56_000557 [Candida oxycetoniae]KAI3406711.2 hypothetical protein KGF56_000557 [Candida oxycetoniae]